VESENHNYGPTDEYILRGEIEGYEHFLAYIEGLPNEGSP